MSSFHLQIVTPDGQFFDGQAERLIVRTTSGDVAVMARHANYVAALGMGRAVVVTETGRKTASCIGGMLSVNDGEASVIATAFEWADQIDLPRAQNALSRAEAALANDQLSPEAHRLAELARQRAKVRIRIGEEK